MDQIEFERSKINQLLESIEQQVNHGKLEGVEDQFSLVRSSLLKLQLLMTETKLVLVHSTLLTEPIREREFRNELRKYKRRVSNLENDFEWARSTLAKKELIGSVDFGWAKSSADPTGKSDLTEKPDLIETDLGQPDLGQTGVAVLAESHESLQRTQVVIRDTRQIANHTVVKIGAQKEQLQATNVHLQQLGSELDRSRAVMRRIARRVASDRWIWLITGLCIIVIVVIIILTQY